MRELLEAAGFDAYMVHLVSTKEMKRRKTLGLLVEDYGCGSGCGALDAPIGRWALMERDAVGGNGGPWWRTGDDWRELLDDSAQQECALEWPAEHLFDLDSFEGRDGWSTGVEIRYAPLDLIDEESR